jgi:hypothetical protein
MIGVKKERRKSRSIAYSVSRRKEGRTRNLDRSISEEKKKQGSLNFDRHLPLEASLMPGHVPGLQQCVPHAEEALRQRSGVGAWTMPGLWPRTTLAEQRKMPSHRSSDGQLPFFMGAIGNFLAAYSFLCEN